MKRMNRERLRGVYVRAALAPALIMMMLALSGCLYPKENIKMSLAPKEAVRNAQAALDQYYGDTGLLPIHNSSQEVPVYEKFRLDFNKLQGRGYLGSIPGAAFENGGNYYFLVIDEETVPRIKLMDIVTVQKLNDIQSWVRSHMQGGGALPKEDELYPGFYALDYGKLNRTAPTIKSVFSGQTLGAMVDDEGIVYTDYGIDIMQLLQRGGDIAYDEDLDLRTLLVDSSDFVPVKSPVYRLVNGEPVAVKP